MDDPHALESQAAPNSATVLWAKEARRLLALVAERRRQQAPIELSNISPALPPDMLAQWARTMAVVVEQVDAFRQTLLAELADWNDVQVDDAECFDLALVEAGMSTFMLDVAALQARTEEALSAASTETELGADATASMRKALEVQFNFVNMDQRMLEVDNHEYQPTAIRATAAGAISSLLNQLG